MNKDENESQFKLNRTGLIYDPLMLDFHCEWDPQYPEKPDRIKKPYERCQFYGLTEKCIPISGRFCTDQEVEKCHTARVNKLMKDSAKMNYDELKHLSTIYDSMFWHQNSDKAARFALGSSLELVDHIMDGKVENGYAIIRPPGHHAMHDEPNGYCYFNNASIVAKHAIEKYGLERVLIIDWDVHHGQGTQYLFYDDPKVLYVSWHRYDYGDFWPNLRKSDFDHIGEGAGKGYNINIPLNKIGLGNSEYAASFHNVILPIAYEYNPQLVIVSCGYDAAIGCFEGKMRVTPAGYAHFINALSCLSNGKLCVLLEGGYCIKSLSKGVALTLRALLGYPTPRIEDLKQPDPVFVETLRNLVSVLRPHWKCLQNLNDADESIKLSEYLEKWDVENRKNRGIKFFDLNDRPQTFPLTGFYPLYSDEENARLDLEIDDLIKTTDLSFPRGKTCVSIGDQAIKDSIKESSLKSSGELAFENPSQSVLSIVDSIGQKNFMNGLVVSTESSLINEVVRAASHARSKYVQVKKTLVVNLSQETLFDKVFGKSQESLLVSFNQNDAQDVSSNKISIQLDNPPQDVDFLTAFWRVLIPIAYQFNPDLVFLFVDAKTPLSTSGLGQITRILNSLANGNLIVAFQTSSNPDDETKLKVDKCLSILLGNPCDPLEKLTPSDKLQGSLKAQILSLKTKWSCFQFNDKLPSD